MGNEDSMQRAGTGRPWSARVRARARGWAGSVRAALARPGDRGATTAEFAIVTMAAVGFAGLLVVILQSDQVRAILEDLVQRALSTGG